MSANQTRLGRSAIKFWASRFGATGREMLAVGRAHAVAARGLSPDAMATHHALDPLAAHGLPFGTQLGMDVRRAVSSPMVSMNPLDIAQEFTMGDLARALRPGPPEVVA